MSYRKVTRKCMRKGVVDEVNDFIDSVLRRDYGLDLTRRDKPDLHVNDLLLVLHHHWVLDTETFPDERQRVQLAALLLTAAYTASRPGSLVYTKSPSDRSLLDGKAQDTVEPSKTLCYKDVKVLLLRNSDRQERDVMLMELDLTHVKGDQITPKPKKFLLHEHDNLALCPIIHILALAFADDAFEPKIAQKVDDLFYAEASSGGFVTHIRFKPQMDDIPIFRQAVHSARGSRTSAQKAMRYHVFNDYLQRLGRSTGFRQILTAYCVRRGTGNAMDGVASDAERNQVMGHQSASTFQFYLNHHVKFDVQAAYLGSPSQHAHNVALGCMGRSLDRRAPTKLSPAQRAAIKSDPTITRLRTVRDGISKEILKNPAFQTLNDAKETEVHERYKQAQRALNAARRYRTKAAPKEAREEYFRTISTIDLDEQYSRLPTRQVATELTPAQAVEKTFKNRTEEPQLPLPDTVTHTFKERTRIGELLFEDTSTLSRTAKLDRRIEAIATMTALCSLREPRRRERPTNPSGENTNCLPQPQSMQSPLEVPQKCLATQCIFCLGDTALSNADRAFCFSCQPAAKRHMRKQHLERMAPEEKVSCPHPTCHDLPLLDGIQQFKIHAARVHGVRL